jgi:hypothetical protein
MAQKHTIQLTGQAQSSAVKETAAQLAGKKPQDKKETWIQTFAASGAKTGGKGVVGVE